MKRMYFTHPVFPTPNIGKTADFYVPNHELYGYGYDVYIIVDNQEELQEEFDRKNLKVVKKISVTDYNNKELVLEDIDGRWLGFGIKLNTNSH